MIYFWYKYLLKLAIIVTNVNHFSFVLEEKEITNYKIIIWNIT